MLRILKNDQCANETKIKGMQMCSVRPCQAGWYIYPWEPVRVLHDYSCIGDILERNSSFGPVTVSTSLWALTWTLFLHSTPEFQHGASARVWALKWAPVPDCTCFLLVPTLWDIEFRTTKYGKYSIGFKGAIIWNNLLLNINNNYSPKWRWLVLDMYRTAKQWGKYPGLATDTEVNNCFSIY